MLYFFFWISSIWSLTSWDIISFWFLCYFWHRFLADSTLFHILESVERDNSICFYKTNKVFPTSLMSEIFNCWRSSMLNYFCVSVDLVICGLFICEFMYLGLQIDHFSGMYPPIYSHSWYFYMQIRYMQAKFSCHHLLHITCI